MKHPPGWSASRTKSTPSSEKGSRTRGTFSLEADEGDKRRQKEKKKGEIVVLIVGEIEDGESLWSRIQCLGHQQLEAAEDLETASAKVCAIAVNFQYNTTQASRRSSSSSPSFRRRSPCPNAGKSSTKQNKRCPRGRSELFCRIVTKPGRIVRRLRNVWRDRGPVWPPVRRDHPFATGGLSTFACLSPHLPTHTHISIFSIPRLQFYIAVVTGVCRYHCHSFCYCYHLSCCFSVQHVSWSSLSQHTTGWQSKT